MRTRRIIVLALVVASLGLISGAAQADIVTDMNTPRVTSISAAGGVVTVKGEADPAVPGDDVRTLWYTTVAGMQYVEENGSATISRKVTSTADVLDNFNRSNEDPLSGGGNWLDADGTGGTWTSMRLVSNQATRNASQTSMSYWTQDTFSGGEGSVWAKWTAVAHDGGRDSVLLLKDVGQSGAIDGFELAREVAGTGNDYYKLYRMTNGSRTAPTTCTYEAPSDESTVNCSIKNGTFPTYEYFNLRRIGNTVEGWASDDGETWSLILAATDSNHSTGTFYGAIHVVEEINGTDGTIDDFGLGIPGVFDEAEDSASAVTDDGDNITSGEASTMAAANAMAAEVTVTDLNYFSYFDGLVEMVVEPDNEVGFMGDVTDRVGLLVDGFDHLGKPLLVVVQDGSGNNRLISGYAPLGNGSATAAGGIGFGWEADGLGVIRDTDDTSATPDSSPSSGGAVYVTAEDAGNPVLAKGGSGRPEILSLDTPAGTTIFAGVRGEFFDQGDPGQGELPEHGLVEFGWIKSDGAVGFDIGADGPVTSGPCIEGDDTVEGILVGWIDPDDGIYECYYTSTIPQSGSWGADALFSIQNGIPTSHTCSGVTVCGWQFKFAAPGQSTICFYPTDCQSVGQSAVGTLNDQAEFRLVTEYFGVAPTTFDVEFGDSGGGGGFYRGFVIKPGDDPTAADDQVAEAQVDVLDMNESIWTTHSFTYYSGTDRNYTLINLDG
jgi:hypothetical protein